MRSTSGKDTGNGNGSNISGGINWALIVNMLLFGVIIFGGWFTTWAGPTNEKFAALDKAIHDSMVQHDKDMTALARELTVKIDATEKSTALVNKEVEASLDRRFRAQDNANIEIKIEMKRIADDIERRRIEVATKSELQNMLYATKTELAAEIKRVEYVANQALTKAAFDAWEGERDLLIQVIQKRLDEALTRNEATSVWAQRAAEIKEIQDNITALRNSMHEHERDDRVLLKSK